MSPSRLPNAHSWANSFSEWIAEGDLAEVRFGLLRMSDDLRSVTADQAVDLCTQEPRPTGAEGVDAALASLVEFTLNRVGARAPGWAKEAAGSELPFYIVSNTSLRPIVVRSTPTVFAKRNVWVSGEYFESV